MKRQEWTAQTREWDRHCTCRCGYCLTHDHERCINPSHAAAFRREREREEVGYQ